MMMTQDLGATPSGSGSRPTDQAPSGLGASRFDPSRGPMPTGRPLHVVALFLLKRGTGGELITSMIMSYRTGVSRDAALGSAMEAAATEKPGFSVRQWLIQTFEDENDAGCDSDTHPKGGDASGSGSAE